MIPSKGKFTSVTYIPPRPPPPPPCTIGNMPPKITVTSETCHCPAKSNCPPLPKVTCNDIPKIQIHKPSQCAPVPTPACFNEITCPKIVCPPIQCIPPNPIDINIQHDLPAGSCSMCDTYERESNTVALISGNKTTVLCSEGYERKAKFITRKDLSGMSHTYCKESETRNNISNGGGDRTVSKPFIPTKPNACFSVGSTHGRKTGECFSDEEKVE